MKISLAILLTCLSLFVKAQPISKVAPVTGEILPAWAIEMYGDHPNVWKVDDEYRKWRTENPNAKTTFSQYYKNGDTV